MLGFIQRLESLAPWFLPPLTEDETEPPLNFTVAGDASIELDDFSMPNISDLIDDDMPDNIKEELVTLAPILQNYIAPRTAKQTQLDGIKKDSKTVVIVCSAVFVVALAGLIGFLVRRECSRVQPYHDFVR